MGKVGRGGNHAFLQADDTSERCVQARRQESAGGAAAAAAGGGFRGLGGRVRLHPLLGAPAALGFVPSLGEHPGGAGGRTGVHLPPILRAGRKSGAAAEARRRSDQQASIKR